MKIQLQPNYSTRNLGQKTNKSETCSKPAFKGTWQIFIPGEEYSVNRVSIIKNYLQSLGVFGKIIEGERNFLKQDWVHTLKFSCAEALDGIANDAIKEIQTWKLTARKPIKVYPYNGHSLTTEQLANVEFEVKPPGQMYQFVSVADILNQRANRL